MSNYKSAYTNRIIDFHPVINIYGERVQHTAMTIGVTHSNIHRCVTNILQFWVREGVLFGLYYNVQIERWVVCIITIGYGKSASVWILYLISNIFLHEQNVIKSNFKIWRMSKPRRGAAVNIKRVCVQNSVPGISLLYFLKGGGSYDVTTLSAYLNTRMSVTRLKLMDQLMDFYETYMYI